jgi:hypothetical protein
MVEAAGVELRSTLTPQHLGRKATLETDKTARNAGCRYISGTQNFRLQCSRFQGVSVDAQPVTARVRINLHEDFLYGDTGHLAATNSSHRDKTRGLELGQRSD